MKEMVSEFKTSVSGSAKEEMENLAKTLGEAGKSLNDFPEKLQIMTDTLNNNFVGLQGVIKNIGKKHLKPPMKINKKCKMILKKWLKFLKIMFQSFKMSKEILLQNNLKFKLSENLLSAFNTSIESMNNISSKVNDILSEFKSVHNGMISATNEFKMISENVNSSTNNTKIAQREFFF